MNLSKILKAYMAYDNVPMRALAREIDIDPDSLYKVVNKVQRRATAGGNGGSSSHTLAQILTWLLAEESLPVSGVEDNQQPETQQS